jgi:hypothetical protein
MSAPLLPVRVALLHSVSPPNGNPSTQRFLNNCLSIQNIFGIGHLCEYCIALGGRRLELQNGWIWGLNIFFVSLHLNDFIIIRLLCPVR